MDEMNLTAVKEYFSYYHEGFNRRTEDPINSRLNYGYAVVRSAIARELVRVLHNACIIDGAKINVMSAI